MSKQHRQFEIIDPGSSGLDGLSGVLNERELGLLTGALNFHSIVQPGRIFKVVVLRGPAGAMPRLTGHACYIPEWAPDRAAVCHVAVRSTLGADMPSDLDVPLIIDLGGEPVEGSAIPRADGLRAKILRRARSGAPIAYDALRQAFTDLYEARITPRRRPARAPGVEIPAESALKVPHSGQPAILFGLHWLEMGGAERWALDTISAAKSLGFLPIVITDRESPQPWITRPELDGALIIPLSLPLVDGEDSRLLLGLLSEYSIRGVHVHHSAWLYHRLAWLKAMNPILTIVDSLHIVEWRTGGFVEMAIKLSNLIDIHHVISPQLRDYMILNRDIPKERVVLAPLYDLSATESDVGQKSNPSNPFIVAFVGRLSQQKRPYLFLKYASKLRKIAGERVRFIVHGDGVLSNETERLIEKYGLNSCLELRRPPRSVDETLTESDLLVISSDNEGLTLTSFEATARNVAVLSTDVGSQASIVARDYLVSRQPFEFVGEAVSRTLAIMESEDLRQNIIGEQREKITALRELPEAHAWLKSVYEGWMK